MAEETTKVRKTKRAKKVIAKAAIGTFKVPSNLQKGLMKAAQKQGFTKIGFYAVG